MKRIVLLLALGCAISGCMGPMASLQTCLNPGSEVQQTAVTTLYLGAEKYMYEAIAPSCHQGPVEMQRVPNDYRL